MWWGKPHRSSFVCRQKTRPNLCLNVVGKPPQVIVRLSWENLNHYLHVVGKPPRVIARLSWENLNHCLNVVGKPPQVIVRLSSENPA